MRIAILVSAIALACAGCTSGETEGQVATVVEVTDAQTEQIEQLMQEHGAKTLGIGIIRDGELAWTGYFGEQSPGVEATSTTLFNTASVSKAITAETAIRLVDKGLIDLDEPIAAHFIYDGMEGDANYARLTPRILLNHTSGFRNWPWEYDDGKLAFDNPPGEAFGYSGIGFVIFSRFLEEKLGKSFPEIVKEHVHVPLGMENASHQQQDWMVGRRVMPLGEDGEFLAEFPHEMGYYNAADEYYTTVEDHARFLIAVMENSGAGADAPALRQTIQTSIADSPIWGCQGQVNPCPDAFGHSVGYFVFEYGERLNIQHGGNDMSEAATGYFKTDTRDGMVVFANAPAPDGILLYLKVVDLLDEDQDFTKVFWAIVDRFFTPSEEEEQPDENG